MERLRKIVHIKEFVAEFIGTFILVVITKSCSLSLAALPSPVGSLVGCLAGGLGVMTGIIVTGGASGGHINPAVSVAMVSCNKLPLAKLPSYLLGQYLGAGVGSLLVVGIYSGWMDGQHVLALATYPGLATDILSQILDQATATFLLVLGIFAVVGQGLQPPSLLVGMVVVAVSLALGQNAGAAMNPAVDFMPRVISALVTLSWRPFIQGNYFWWVPLVVPHIGGILAAFTYKYGIERFEESKESESKDKENTINEESGKLGEAEIMV